MIENIIITYYVSTVRGLITTSPNPPTPMVDPHQASATGEVIFFQVKESFIDSFNCLRDYNRS